MLQHESVVGYGRLQRICRRYDIHGIAGRLGHLAKAQDQFVAEMMRLCIFHICDEDTQFPEPAGTAQLVIAHFHRSFNDGFL